MMKNRFLVFLLSSGILYSCEEPKKLDKVEQWDVYEIALEGPSIGNPYMEVDLSANFVHQEKTVTVPGFYDGEGLYKIRFSPDRQGSWRFQTNSNIPELAEMNGEIMAIAPTGENHGPVVPVNTHYLQYADGATYYGVGTTAYQWTSVKQTIQEETLQSLTKSPFNKIRMCVFPKSYQYGNESEPWAYPFHREGEDNDFGLPNFEFFQNIDQRIQQLLDRGIQADLILFHPYDRWGYAEMGKEMNEKYVRYIMARLSAFRNIWWSMANEWDVPKIKDSIDWEGLGTLLEKEDPHQRLRGIHNWYGSEDHFYDHSRNWITHTSTQTSQFYNAIKWREKFRKPLLFDEMRYEGDVASGWGNLSSEEMASYFWMAGLSGGYGTHGDTFQNDADEETEVRWWAKGGRLVGDSPERIQYFKNIMEQAPVINMIPELVVHGDSSQLNNNVYLLSQPGNYYLAYVAREGTEIVLNLEGDEVYELEAFDTWNMITLESKTVGPGGLSYTTPGAYTALRVTAK